MSHQRYVSAYPKSIGSDAQKFAGDYNDPLKKSPCSHRPDTLLPCPLLKKDKKNRICNNCGLIPGKGKKIFSDLEINLAIANGLLDSKPNPKKEKKIYTCEWPGCEKKIRSGRFCKPHGGAFYTRESWYKKRYGEEAPFSWLTRPVKHHKKRSG